MGLSVCLLRDPELTTWGKFCIVANESAGATDGEQRRWDERFPPRSGRRFAIALHSGFFHSHDRPPYACRRSMGCAVLAGEQHLICPMISVAPIENFRLIQSGVPAWKQQMRDPCSESTLEPKAHIVIPALSHHVIVRECMVPWWYVETCRNYIQERTRLRH